MFGNRETVRKCDWIWPNLMIFFWVLFVLLYIRLATEKMWATSRKYVFYDIFKNTTKHQKIFFENFFEMQPNTWKHFPFRKIAFPENGIFSRNAFTRTKHSLSFNNLIGLKHCFYIKRELHQERIVNIEKNMFASKLQNHFAICKRA